MVFFLFVWSWSVCYVLTLHLHTGVFCLICSYVHTLFLCFLSSAHVLLFCFLCCVCVCFSRFCFFHPAQVCMSDFELVFRRDDHPTLWLFSPSPIPGAFLISTMWAPAPASVPLAMQVLSLFFPTSFLFVFRFGNIFVLV